MEIDPVGALNRFGLGPRLGDAPASDPIAAMRADISAPDPVRFPPTLGTAADGLVLLREQRRLRPPPGLSFVRPVLAADSAAQLDNLLVASAPFRERLVLFWANHFTVSTRKAPVRAVAGAFVREAIRPHVFGRFDDMLLAVVRHPAMLFYLDNVQSVGPSSPVGLRRGRGLNENLARECLELHTVGLGAGYTQADVTSFAAILTGWSVDMQAAAPGFAFRAGAHEPGAKMLLGTRYPEGERGGVLALSALARHPATIARLARKLATHFFGDDPSPAAVAPIERVLARSDGDLGAAAASVLAVGVTIPPGGKFRTPLDHVVAVERALGRSPDGAAGRGNGTPRLAGALRSLGQPWWEAPLPNGWPDTAAEWSAPADLVGRVDWSFRAAGSAPAEVEPRAIALASLGPALRPQTLAAMAGAGDRRDALTLLFTSPEFQRR